MAVITKKMAKLTGGLQFWRPLVENLRDADGRKTRSIIGRSEVSGQD